MFFGLSFNLKCTAAPTGDLIFECFDLAPDTDFDAFNLSIANSAPIDCAGDMIYSYQVAVSYTKATEAGGIDQGIFTYTPGDVKFDPEFALNVSMFSTLVSHITLSPTAVANETLSPTAAPVARSSAAKVAVTGSAYLVAALALWL